MADLREIVADPDFAKLPIASQRSIATDVDPDFGKLPPEAQDRALVGLAPDPHSFAEARYGLPAGTLRGIEKVESGGNPAAVSPTGVRGLMQITGATAKAYGLPPELHLDPTAQIDTAGRIMADNLKRANGDISKALSLYGDPKDTGYAQKVLDAVAKVSQETASPEGQRPSLIRTGGGGLVRQTQEGEGTLREPQPGEPIIPATAAQQEMRVRWGFDALKAGAVIAAPELVGPEMAGASLAMRVAHGLLRSVAAGGAGTAVEVGRRVAAGERMPSGVEMGVEVLANAGPQVVAELGRPLLMTLGEMGALDRALSGEVAKVEALPGAIAPRQSVGTLGRELQRVAGPAERVVERRKAGMYNREVVEAQRLGLSTSNLDPVKDAAQSALDALNVAGIPEAQMSGPKAVLQGIVDKASKTNPGNPAMYGELDSMRRDLQRHVRAFGDLTSRRTFEKGSIEHTYSLVQGEMDRLAAGTSVEPLARKADIYFRDHVAPTRNAIETVMREAEPAAVMRVLMATGSQEQLPRLAKVLPKDMLQKMRAGWFNQMLDETRIPGSTRIDTIALGKKVSELTPFQQRFLAGQPRSAVEQTLNNIRVLMARGEGPATEAIRKATRAAATGAAGTTAGLAVGLYEGMDDIRRGNMVAGVSKIAAGGLGGRFLARVLASPKASAMFNRLANPETTRGYFYKKGAKAFGQFVATVGADVLESGVRALDEAEGQSPPGMQPPPTSSALPIAAPPE